MPHPIDRKTTGNIRIRGCHRQRPVWRDALLLGTSDAVTTAKQSCVRPHSPDRSRFRRRLICGRFARIDNRHRGCPVDPRESHQPNHSGGINDEFEQTSTSHRHRRHQADRSARPDRRERAAEVDDRTNDLHHGIALALLIPFRRGCPASTFAVGHCSVCATTRRVRDVTHSSHTSIRWSADSGRFVEDQPTALTLLLLSA